jgi:hypothetical protein
VRVKPLPSVEFDETDALEHLDNKKTSQNIGICDTSLRVSINLGNNPNPLVCDLDTLLTLGEHSFDKYELEGGSNYKNL